jgi:hypothetical protein
VAKVHMVAHFSDGEGDITPDLTTLDGLAAGVDQLVAERWAWMQPVFRRRDGTASDVGLLTDPFVRR